MIFGPHPPSNPNWLEPLALHGQDNKCDRSLAKLLQVITCVECLSNNANYTEPTNANDEQNFAPASLKRLDAEVLLDAGTM